MALKSTVHKVLLNITDMDRDYYADHNLTVACHPSETEERLMVRLLAFALFAHEDMQFTRGLSSEDEPDLWQKDLTGAIEHWIELGMPDESRIRKGCNRARRMTVVTYGDRAPQVWWDKIRSSVARFDNLRVINLSGETTQALGTRVERSMQLQITIQDGVFWVSSGDAQVELPVVYWK